MLAGCGPAQQGNTAASEQPPLAGARIGGAFTLTDQDGKSVRWDDFKGKYRIVYFGYSYCPDVCPVDLQRIMQGYRLLEKKAPAKVAKIVPIFISVDPERDTPAVLKTYVSAFDPRLIGLTGTSEQIAAAAKTFVVVYGKEGTGKDYLVSHTRTPYLFGPAGDPIALLPVDDPTTADKPEGSPQDIADTLDRWVQ